MGFVMKGMVIFADDEQGLVSYISQKTLEKRIEDTVFCTSLKDVISVMDKSDVKRLVLDNVFPDEDMRGIDVLERASECRPKPDLVLLTGWVVDDDLRSKTEDIGARIVRKGSLNWKQIFGLLSGSPDSVTEPTDPVGNISDVGELRLRLEDSQVHQEGMKRWVDVIAHNAIAELLSEIGATEGLGDWEVVSGTTARPLVELERAVREKDTDGLELIALHQEWTQLWRQRKKGGVRGKDESD